MTFPDFLAQRVRELERENELLRKRLWHLRKGRDMWRDRARTRFSGPRLTIFPETAHGTRTGYKYGCRCSACRRAEADYQRDRRQVRVA